MNSILYRLHGSAQCSRARILRLKHHSREPKLRDGSGSVRTSLTLPRLEYQPNRDGMPNAGFRYDVFRSSGIQATLACRQSVCMFVWLGRYEVVADDFSTSTSWSLLVRPKVFMIHHTIAPATTSETTSILTMSLSAKCRCHESIHQRAEDAANIAIGM